jgi:hypothetical protein
MVIFSHVLEMFSPLALMPSPSQAKDVGGSSGDPTSIRSSPLKRPMETNTKNQPVTKRAKPSTSSQYKAEAFH